MATAMRKMILVSMMEKKKKRNKEEFLTVLSTNLFGFKVRLVILV